MLGMISCKEASELISKSLDTKLTFRKGIALAIHKFFCPCCRGFEKNLRKIHEHWSNLDLEKHLPGLSDEEKLKLQAVIDNELK